MNNAFGLPLPQQVFGHPPAELLRHLGGASDGPGRDRRDPFVIRPEDAGPEVEEIPYESGPSAHWR